MCNKRDSYPTDINDKAWALIEPLFPKVRTTKPRKYELREIIDAIFYITRAGCAWRLLPNNFPPWRRVYFYFWCWRHSGLWEKINMKLVERARKKTGRREKPSMALIDSQSVRTANGGEQIGIDGHKKINGRKRHLVTDTLGNILAVTVTAANVSDVAGGEHVLAQLDRQWKGQTTRLKTILADKAYRSLAVAILITYGWLIRTPADRKRKWKGFVVQKFRWVIERTNAWQGRYRRLSKDYEHTVRSSASMCYIASIHRLASRVR
jgi:putative transposase